MMGAQQLDTGVREVQVAHHKIAALFNNKDWKQDVCYCLAKARGRADCSTYLVALIDHSVVTEKQWDISKLCSETLVNLEKRGKHNMAVDN